MGRPSVATNVDEAPRHPRPVFAVRCGLVTVGTDAAAGQIPGMMKHAGPVICERPIASSHPFCGAST
jgi:hypothetical protein